MMDSDPRGSWKHYKGHFYEVVGIAKHSETLEELGIAYRRIDTDEIWVWVRPTAMFSESVELPDGKSVARFEKLSGRWTEDRTLPEDGAISAAHPLRSGDHALYAEAVRLVGAKHSKYALVDLVNWLLAENKKLKSKTK